MTTDQLVKELGIEGSDEAFQNEMIGKIMATANLRFFRAVDDLMTEEEAQEFETFSEDKGFEEVAQWIEGKFPGISETYPVIVQGVVKEIKEMGSQS